LFVLWLEAEQLTVLDASEGVPLRRGAFRRAWLPSPGVGAEVAQGRVPPGGFACVDRHGVLQRRRRRCAPQAHRRPARPDR
jgi:hypothetical protein